MPLTCTRRTLGKGRLLGRVLGLLSVIKVLEYVGLLVGGVVPDVLLDGLNLLDQVELVLLC